MGRRIHGGVKMIFLDAKLGNADWNKQTWDLPSYKSDDFLSLFPDLIAFRQLPVYSFAVVNGLIKDDEWIGKQDRE